MLKTFLLKRSSVINFSKRLKGQFILNRGEKSQLLSLWSILDVLKKVSRGFSRVEAGNPGFPRLVQVTSGGFSWWL